LKNSKERRHFLRSVNFYKNSKKSFVNCGNVFIFVETKQKTHAMNQIVTPRLTAQIKKEITSQFKGYKFSIRRSSLGMTGIEIYILSAPYAMTETDHEQINQFSMERFYSGRKLSDIKKIYSITRPYQVWADITIGKWNKPFQNTGA
jgi:hypothetical protein